MFSPKVRVVSQLLGWSLAPIEDVPHVGWSSIDEPQIEMSDPGDRQERVEISGAGLYLIPHVADTEGAKSKLKQRARDPNLKSFEFSVQK